MICPCCGGAELERDTREVDANGVHVVVTGDFCPACREVILDRENGERYSAALKRGRLLAKDRLTNRCQTRSTAITTPRLFE